MNAQASDPAHSVCVAQAATSRCQVLRVPASHTRFNIDQVDEVMGVCEAIAATLAESIENGDIFARNAERRAFVSFVTPDYRWGLVVWLRSLRRVSARPVILLVAKELDLPKDAVDVHQIVVPALAEPTYRPSREEFTNVLAKLWAFALTPLARVFFIDVDCLILGPIDHLFAGDAILVCPDYVETRNTERFNVGVMVFSPTLELRDHVFATSPGVESYDGGDQGVLNVVLGDRVTFIAEKYNVLRHFFHYAAKSDADDIRILHYVVKKPWELQYRESPDAMLVELDDRWTSFLTHDELLQLVQEWRRSIFFVSERARIESVRGPTLAPLMSRVDALETKLSGNSTRILVAAALALTALAGAVLSMILRKWGF